MKHSIKNIFANLTKFLSIITLMIILIALLTVENHMSYIKINNLKNQKEVADTLTTIKKRDIELALIEFNAKSNQLRYDINKLKKLIQYDYTGKIFFSTTDEYIQDLNQLETLTNDFNKIAKLYYVKDLKPKNEKEILQKLKKSLFAIDIFIDNMILKEITYKEQKFYIFEKIILLVLLLSIFTLFWYKKRLNLIYNDLIDLYAIDKSQKNIKTFSQEADAIRLRLNKKNTESQNPAMIDPVTQIKNHLGMMNSYANKKGLKDSNFTSVTIFEIDNFSKQKRTFSQEFTQTILKKVAFTISLHEQATDIIARTDYNQFTVILSRASKEQSFKDIDIIRQSIEEIKFKEPGGDAITITVSGGYMVKPANQSIEEALKIAREVLHVAKKSGRNSIAQTKDLTRVV
jgi:diguanylate cyclase (GGDEF)-like protein